MNEQAFVKQILTKNIITNFITIIVILIFLGFFIYASFSRSIFSSSDKELKNAYLQMVRFKETENSNSLYNDLYFKKIEIIDDLYKLMLDEASPRIMYLLRNSDGDIISDISQGGYVSQMFSNISFDTNNLNRIYSCTLDGSYQYRTIIFQWDSNLYGQALINVDSEIEIIQRFKTNLITAIGISILMIAIGSYYLSRRTLKPIINCFKKQQEFVQNASHELRTPLTIIQAKQETLLEKPNSTILDNAKEISITLKETTRLKKLISQLMQEASTSNKPQLNISTFDIDNEIRDLEILYKDLAKNQNKKLKVNLDFNSQLMADEDKIKELIIILLDNAFKYTNKSDTITITTAKKDNKCIIEVEDTGIGISKEALKHIFERFYREEQSRQRDKGGMGLGLSLAYEIVKEHKGQIKVVSNENEGSKFIIKLPLKQKKERDNKEKDNKEKDNKFENKKEKE